MPPLPVFRPLLDRPGHAAAVASTLAFVVAVSLPASLLVRVRGWSPLRLAPGLMATGSGPLEIGVPWGDGALGPTGLRSEELEGFVVLLALLVAAVVIVCVLNLAVLLMQHLSTRRREFAIRRALGGTRSRLRRDLLLQGAVLTAVGAVAGGATGTLALLALPGLMPALVESAGGYAPRPVVAAALAGPTLAVVAAGYGLVGPAMAGGSTRLGGRRSTIARGLSAAFGPARWEKGLAALQCGLLVVLLAGSGLLLRGSWDRGSDPGPIDAPDQLRIRDVRLGTGGAVQSSPSDADSASTGVAVASEGAVLGLGTRAAILCRGCRRGAMATPVMRVRPRIHAVGPRWFDVLGTPVIRGRDIRVDDDRESPPVAAVNRAFAARYGIGVGARLQLPGRRYSEEWVRVVGVVENVQPPGLGSPARPVPAVYLSALQNPPLRVTVVGRGDADPLEALGFFSGAEGAASGSAGIGELRRLTESLAEHREPEERLRDASVLLALLAWGSGLGGLAAVTALTLRRRWRELGIRRAVGARRRDVLALVLRDNLRTLGVGAAIGAVLVTPEARALAELVQGLGGAAPGLYYAAAVAAVGLTVAATTWIPVRGANRLAPRQMMARE